MYKRVLIMLTTLAALAMSGAAPAATGHAGALPANGMTAPGKMYLLGNQTVAGVKAMAHVKDVRKAMAKVGLKQTHHLMILFENVKTGKPIRQGTAAVKVKDPSGAVSATIQLGGMGGPFGVDLTLPKPGRSAF